MWAGIAGGFLLLTALVNPAGMGMGDVKLLAVMGLFLGRPVVVALVLALLGPVFAGVILARRKGVRRPASPRCPSAPTWPSAALWLRWSAIRSSRRYLAAARSVSAVLAPVDGTAEHPGAAAACPSRSRRVATCRRPNRRPNAPGTLYTRVPSLALNSVSGSYSGRALALLLNRVPSAPYFATFQPEV